MAGPATPVSPGGMLPMQRLTTSDHPIPAPGTTTTLESVRHSVGGVHTFFCARRLSRKRLGRGGRNGPFVVAATHSGAARQPLRSSSRVSPMSCPSGRVLVGGQHGGGRHPRRHRFTARVGGLAIAVCTLAGSAVVIGRAAQARAVLDHALTIDLGDNWRGVAEAPGRRRRTPSRSCYAH